MYRKILIALDNSPADENILAHVAQLAGLFHSEIVLLHVADGWVARSFEQFKLAESEEMKNDRAYLETVADRFRNQGIKVDARLALGDPPREILKAAKGENCDLIAMAGHGHRWFGDILHGSTITQVRHETTIPLLIVRGGRKSD